MGTRLLAAGSNARGQLGIGSYEDSHRFSPASFLGCPDGRLPSTPLSVAGGANHTLVLLEGAAGSPELWGTGDGSSGQLGTTVKTDITIFKPIVLRGLEDVRCRLIAASWETSYAVFTADNQPDVLISMGADDFGDLGIGKQRKGKAAARAGYHTVKLVHLLENVDSNTLRVDWLSAGPHHVVLRLSASHKRASHRKAAIVGWGACRHGQLGEVAHNGKGKAPTFVDTPRVIMLDYPSDPVERCAVGHHHTVLLRRSGLVSCFGSDRKSQLTGIEGGTGVKTIGCTWHGTYVVGEDDIVRATGSNIHGQLGTGSATTGLTTEAVVSLPSRSEYQLRDLACGSEHVLARLERTNTTVSEVLGWGWNEHGNLGTGGLEDVVSPAKVWPQEDAGTEEIVGIWAGLATSWIAV
ncbi:regulator of chromosome condensation 1/beta-lactamase-inhibitor protein II [Schizophyllum fasciatum]